MKNVQELAKEFNLELPDGFEKKLLENYKTVPEFNKTKEKAEKLEADLKEKDGTIKELNDSISAFDGEKGKLEELQKQVETYQTKEAERVELEKQKSADETIKKSLMEAIGEKEFTNSLVEESIFNKVKEDLGKDENKGKGIKDLLDVYTKDVDGVWKNPNEPGPKTPEFNQGNLDTNDDSAIRSVMGLPPIK